MLHHRRAAAALLRACSGSWTPLIRRPNAAGGDCDLVCPLSTVKGLGSWGASEGLENLFALEPPARSFVNHPLNARRVQARYLAPPQNLGYIKHRIVMRRHDLALMRKCGKYEGLEKLFALEPPMRSFVNHPLLSWRVQTRDATECTSRSQNRGNIGHQYGKRIICGDGQISEDPQG